MFHPGENLRSKRGGSKVNGRNDPGGSARRRRRAYPIADGLPSRRQYWCASPIAVTYERSVHTELVWTRTRKRQSTAFISPASTIRIPERDIEPGTWWQQLTVSRLLADERRALSLV